ncbi:MAG: TlpA disulfide reductase family protein [Candidatus Omnitrophota bacterium]
MKRYFLKILSAAVVFCFLFSGCGSRPEAAPKAGSIDIAPDFTLPDLKEEAVTLSSYKGKQPVFLFFWTTWCPYCRQGLSNLNRDYAELTQKGWKVLAVNLGEPAEKVKRFIGGYSPQYRVLLDEGLIAANAYDILGVPTYVLIDKNGLVVFKDNYLPDGALAELISQ